MNQRFPLHSTPLFPIALQIKTQFFFFFGTNNTQNWSHIGKIINGGKKSNWFVGLQKPTPFDIETEGSLDEQLCFWSPNNIEH